jgi:hypothetical protein
MGLLYPARAAATPQPEPLTMSPIAAQDFTFLDIWPAHLLSPESQSFWPSSRITTNWTVPSAFD